VLATANQPEQLDPAIPRRPGRFDRVVPFQLLNVELRRE
jgi:ATP-dependent 26S proteasome regulatory subunit